jgi:sugar O-acyltransferase (sialic acid O-acetyltransferase NeuD family)
MPFAGCTDTRRASASARDGSLNTVRLEKMKLVILGSGGHAKVVAATAVACGHELIGFFDDRPDRWSTSLCGRPVGGPIAAMLQPGGDPVIQGIGDNRIRVQFAARYTFIDWVHLIHPHAFVDPSAVVGPGTVVFAGAVVQPDARIGEHVIINTGASVDHDCIVDDGVHLAPGVHLAGHVQIGRGALVGVGAVVIPRIRIGEWAIIGAGAVVTRDVPAHATVAGVPAAALTREHNDA